MIERFKTKLWKMLRKKDISLAILFNHQGNILWTQGRSISGRNVLNGKGFSKSNIRKVLKSKEPVEVENIPLDQSGEGVSDSACILRVKSLMVFPISNAYYLYVDSGINERFSPKDKEVIKIMGEMLVDTISKIEQHESQAGGITGKSRSIDKIRKLVLKYSLEEDAILMLGETGVGKSHIAELIHRYSGRTGKFITVNTPGIPRDLFESELFGHKRGAFSGALHSKPGFIDEATGGTLFLDEICDVPPMMQAKLLRFIETRKYIRLGDPTERTANVRIIAATNRNINRALEKQIFRQDLYYRLNTLEITIPPLRDRKEDIGCLIDENRDQIRGKKLTEDFRDELYNYSWPGNIRELFSIITRIGLEEKEILEGKDFQKLVSVSGKQASESNSMNNVSLMRKKLKTGMSFWRAVKDPFMKRDVNRNEVTEVIKSMLRKGNGTYKDSLPYLNIPKSEHKKLLDFINNHKLW